MLHLAVRFGLRWSTLVRGDWLGLALTSAVYYFCAGTVWKAASAPCCTHCHNPCMRTVMQLCPCTLGRACTSQSCTSLH